MSDLKPPIGRNSRLKANYSDNVLFDRRYYQNNKQSSAITTDFENQNSFLENSLNNSSLFNTTNVNLENYNHMDNKPRQTASKVTTVKVIPDSSDSHHRRANNVPVITPRKTLTDLNQQFQFQSISINSDCYLSSSYDESFLNKKSPDGDPILRGIFSLEGKSIDLELYKSFIKWKPISENKSKKISTNVNECQYDLEKFYSIEPKLIPRRKNAKQNNLQNLQHQQQLTPTPTTTATSMLPNSKSASTINDFEEDFYTDGFLLHMFAKEKPNIYRHKCISFQHPHRETCKEWTNKIRELIPIMQDERKILILLNPYSGERKTRSILNHQIAPILYSAYIKFDIIEFHDILPIKESLLNNNIHLKDYFGVIIMAGDSSTSKVINQLIELDAQEEDNLDLDDLSNLSNRLKTPFCLIPVGSTNMIAHSIYGTTDVISPLMYLLYGISIKIDICSVYTNLNKLHSLGFGFSCGFGTTMARYFMRYSKLGMNKVQTSVARGAAKQRQRPIDVEIHYLPSDGPQPSQQDLCVKGCEVCNIKETNLQLKTIRDQVEEFDPIAHSIEEIEDNLSIKNGFIKKNYSDWEVIRGSFIHIALLSNATLSDISSGGGLSKYAHLGDGCIDLILVDSVSRKDFYRFLKRHTNVKNQLDLPFVKSVRIKEAKIKILNSNNFELNRSSIDDTRLSLNKELSLNQNNTNITRTNHFHTSNRLNKNKLSKSYNLGSSGINGFYSDESDDNYETPSFNLKTDRGSMKNHMNSINETSNNVRLNNKLTHHSKDKPVGYTMYHIKKSDKKENTSSINQAFENDEYISNNEVELSKKNRSSLRKSRSILSFLKGEDSSNKNTNSINLNEDKTNSYIDNYYTNGERSSRNSNIFASNNGGRNNFTDSKSFKEPWVWNCDWNLNSLPEMHIKCNKQFLPVFAAGLDPDTQFDENITACLPGL